MPEGGKAPMRFSDAKLSSRIWFWKRLRLMAELAVTDDTLTLDTHTSKQIADAAASCVATCKERCPSHIPPWTTESTIVMRQLHQIMFFCATRI